MSSYNPLTSHILATTDGTIFCPHDDSTYLMNRKIISGMIVVGWAVYTAYKIKVAPKAAPKSVKFHVIDVHRNEIAIREQPNSSVEENSDTTLRAVDSLSTVSIQSSSDLSGHESESEDARPSSFQTSNASTQKSPPADNTQPPPFQAGPIGAVEEEPPKDGKVTKSVQCGGNCNV